MNYLNKISKIVKLSTITGFIFLFFYFTPKAYATCWCNWSWCYEDSSCTFSTSPNRWRGEEFLGMCADSTWCNYWYGSHDDYELQSIPCSNCPHGYGDSSNISRFNRCVYNCANPDGNPGDPIPSTELANIVGRIYEDKDNSGNLNNINEVYGPSSVTCKGNTIGSFGLYWLMEGWGQLITNTDWYCDHVAWFLYPAPWYWSSVGDARWGAYFLSPNRSHIKEGSVGHIRFNGLPAGYEIASWRYSLCKSLDGDGNCATTHTYQSPTFSTGEHVTQIETNLPFLPEHQSSGLSPRDRNYMEIRIRPTVTVISVPPTASCTTTQAVYPYGIASIPFTVTANDTDSDLANIRFYRRPWDPVSQTALDPFNEIGSIQSCSGGSCTRTFTWLNPGYGRWVGYPNVSDSAANHCTGKPNPSAPFADCAPGVPEAFATDNCKIYVDRVPSISQITGPPQVRVGSVNLYNKIANDPDGDQLRYSLTATNSLGNACGTFPLISGVSIVASGTPAGGVDPIMRVYTAVRSSATAPYGSRTQRCFQTVTADYPAFSTYTCNFGTAISTSLLDVAFTNDGVVGTEDRNLYIRTLTYTLSTGEVITVDARTQLTDGNFTIYDRGIFPDTTFDGLDTVTQIDAATSSVMLAWNGALKFPVPWRAPSVIPSPNTCNYNVAVSDQYYAGNSISRAISFCGTAPATPTLVAPDNGASLDVSTVGSSITFRWNTLANWGLPCGPAQNRFQLYLKGPSDTLPLDSYPEAQCSLVNSTTVTCPVSGITELGGYTWKIRAINQGTGATCVLGETCRDSAPWTFTLTDDIRAWYTGIDGDIFSPGLNMSVPRPLNVHVDWSPALLGYGLTSVFSAYSDADGLSGGELTIGNGVEDSDDFITESDLWTKFMPLSNMWPSQFTNDAGVPFFTPPPVTQDYLDAFSSNINPTKVYTFGTADAGKFNNNVDYNWRQGGNTDYPGVVVYYYTPQTPALRINGYVRHATNDPNERLLLISNADVIIDDSIGYTSTEPLKDSRPNLEMGIITTKNIIFEANPTIGSDRSIVVEGPIIAANMVSMNRVRIMPSDARPAEIVRYNYKYLDELTKAERTSSVSNFTGLFGSQIIWLGEN